MELQLFGINHKTSNVSEREQFIINDSNQVLLDSFLKERLGSKIDSFFGISTCNRTEIYILGDPGIAKTVLRETRECLSINIDDKNFYFLFNQDAFIHMSKVASGIDSQVLGEQEIFGQFKKALKSAQDLKIIKPRLLAYSDKVIEIVKQVRTKTQIGLNPLSVSGLSFNLVKNIFEKPEDQNILIVGAGSLAHAVIKNLFKNGIENIRAVNRNIREIIISDEYKVMPTSLEKLHDELEDADIVIASATTDLPLIGKGAVENALKLRKNKPMLLIDLSVPRNIEEEIKNIEQAYLFSIDDIEKALNMIVIESQAAIKELDKKFLKDNINKHLAEFLDSLSEEEISRFKKAEDLKQMITNLATIKSENNKTTRIAELESLDSHVIESMFKRYIDNA
jgi:glutamyl-tRNA reductase